jgi:3-methyladenine DNA glycosylase Tag
LQKFAAIFARAAQRKGGTAALEALLPKPKSPAQLKRTPDDRYLAEMTKCVFRSGFVWQIIGTNGPAPKRHFRIRHPACAMLSTRIWNGSPRTRIVRNAKKIASVRANAAIIRLKVSHGGCRAFLAGFGGRHRRAVGRTEAARRPTRQQHRPFFLRFVGKDTFMLSGDVVTALVRQKIVDKAPSGRKALAAVQTAFNIWRDESGRSLAEISRTLACSVD